MTAAVSTFAPIAVVAAQSSVAISPFVSYVPSAAQNPLAGMALTFGGTTGLALRGSADMSIANPDKIASASGTTATAGAIRPWGADADAMLFLGGLGGGATVFSRSLSPYVFSGIGLSGGDSAGSNVVRNGWSYGAGATIPLGMDADIFGEARWRMSQYVLPTSKNAPDSRSEMRFGLSFHIGGGSRQPAPVPSRGRGRRLDSYDDDVAVVAPVVQPTPVIIMPSEPATATETVVDAPERVVRERVVTVPAEATTRRAESITVMRRASTTARRARGIVYRSRSTTSANSTASSTVRTSERKQTTTTSSSKKGKRTITSRRRG